MSKLRDYTTLASHIIDRIPLVRDMKIPEIPKHEPRIILSPVTGKITQLNASKSLLKQLIYKGNPLPMCPYKALHVYLLRDIPDVTSEAMRRGLYFETMCLGASARGEGTYDLKRHSRTGEKLSDHVRIDNAVDRFHYVVKELGMVVGMGNDPPLIQVYNSIPWEDPIRKWDIDIMLEGTADFFTPIKTETRDIPVVNVDLKLTADRDRCFPPFCWGCPEELDFMEAMMYRKIFGVGFMYLVFDYKANNPWYKDIPVITDINDEDPSKSVKAQHRMNDLDQSIRWTAGTIQMWEAQGWPKDPESQVVFGKPTTPCKDCPILDCEVRNITEEV